MFMGFCKGTGLTMSAAINIFARACIRQKRIPIDITNGGSWIAPQAQRLGRPR
jgi:antitoxin component of RelBE/YafQ-DinJ toxin-antitoxin module